MSGQERLLAASVGVPDASGAAASAVLYLAAAGVGRFVITDSANAQPDGVAYEVSDGGRPRWEALRDRLVALNPDVQVQAAGHVDRTLACAPTDGSLDAIENGSLLAARLIQELAK